MYVTLLQQHLSAYFQNSLKSNKKSPQTCSDNEYNIIVISNRKGIIPLKFRLLILKFRGAKGFEDTILPPGKKKKKSDISYHCFF